MGGDCIQCEQVSRTHLRRRLFQNGSRQPVERDAGEQLQVCVCVGTGSEGAGLVKYLLQVGSRCSSVAVGFVPAAD